MMEMTDTWRCQFLVPQVIRVLLSHSPEKKLFDERER